MRIFTIGFTQKTAEQFFRLLLSNQADALIDVRLNNKSQLAGFAKYPDLPFFLDRIAHIAYVHDIMLAPTDKILSVLNRPEQGEAEHEEADCRRPFNVLLFAGSASFCADRVVYGAIRYQFRRIAVHPDDPDEGRGRRFLV